jgi:RimJ/RimL family protein N-acetyltransferase
VDTRSASATLRASAAAADGDAFAGDPSWRVTRTLRDGTAITIRPIKPRDREALRRGFQEISAQTRYLRFLGVVGELSEATLTYLTEVDQKDHIALVAGVTSPDLKTERGLGVARIIRLPGRPDVGEAAITVSDDMQRHGVGTALALELERAARANGIHRIRAEVLEGNEAMRAILEAAGATRVEMETEAPGTLSYELVLSHEPSTLLARMVDVLRGAAQTMAVSLRRLMPPA